MTILSDKQIAHVRAYWRETEAIRAGWQSLSALGDKLGCSHALLSRVVHDPTYRPTPPQLELDVRNERRAWDRPCIVSPRAL